MRGGGGLQQTINLKFSIAVFRYILSFDIRFFRFVGILSGFLVWTENLSHSGS